MPTVVLGLVNKAAARNLQMVVRLQNGFNLMVRNQVGEPVGAEQKPVARLSGVGSHIRKGDPLSV